MTADGGVEVDVAAALDPDGVCMTGVLAFDAEVKQQRGAVPPR